MSTEYGEVTSLSGREAALAIVPKITGGASFLSSGWIAYNVWSDKRRRSKTYHRLLALMSHCDMVSSFSYFLSTWPVPQGPNLGWRNPYHYAAVGNAATCTAQAVGIQWGLTSAVLNVALAAHYLLVIRYQATEPQLRKYQPYAVIAAFTIGLSLTIPGIVLDIFGNTNLWCWIAPNFKLCAEEGLTRAACVHRAYKYRWGFYYGPLWTCIILISIAQIALFASVYGVERRALRWRQNHSSPQGHFKHSRQVAGQACWYVGVFYVTWLPYTAIALTGRFFNPHDNFGVLLLVVTCQPIQGFLNLFVYQRKQVKQGMYRVIIQPSKMIAKTLSSLSFRSSSPKDGTSGNTGDVSSEDQGGDSGLARRISNLNSTMVSEVAEAHAIQATSRMTTHKGTILPQNTLERHEEEKTSGDIEEQNEQTEEETYESRVEYIYED